MAWPLGKKKVGWIDMQDVVLAVCAILVDPQAHKSQIYTLTGTSILSFISLFNVLFLMY